MKLRLAVCFALVSTIPAGADSLQVPSHYATIQAAIDAAAPLDTIEVSPGTYLENIFVWQPVRLIGDANTTGMRAIIDGGDVDATVFFVGLEGPETLLQGFVIRNGNYIYGGGISGNGTQATISSCTIEFNQADAGGGIFGCDGLISNCDIRNNTADFGGGVHRCDGDIQQCTISNNNADSYGGGLSECLATIQNSVVSFNTSYNGGGLYECNGLIQSCSVLSNDGSSVGGGLSSCDGPIRDCNISDNTAGNYYGGGLYGGHGEISRSVISHNSAGRYGGGFYAYSGTISDCVISGNQAGAGYPGGGLYDCDGGIRNCTIVGNKAQNGGGLAYCSSITNSIVWFNQPTGPAYQQILSSSTIEYCNVQDGSACVGCIISHPLFVDFGSWSGTDWIDGDYHLRNISACIDAGDPAFASTGTDIEGSPRIANGRVDMGAYEFTGNTSGLPDFDDDGTPDTTDPDIDNDGVLNAADNCDFTPLGSAPDANGTFRGDLDGDCDVDLEDYAIFQADFTAWVTP